MKIKRHTLRIGETVQTVLMPRAGRIFTARVEGSQLALYTLQNPTLPDVKRQVLVLDDEVEIKGYPGAHIATVTHKGTTYHVFEGT